MLPNMNQKSSEKVLLTWKSYAVTERWQPKISLETLNFWKNWLQNNWQGSARSWAYKLELKSNVSNGRLKSYPSIPGLKRHADMQPRNWAELFFTFLGSMPKFSGRVQFGTTYNCCINQSVGLGNKLFVRLQIYLKKSYWELGIHRETWMNIWYAEIWGHFRQHWANLNVAKYGHAFNVPSGEMRSGQSTHRSSYNR